jgi:hypothetical protein
MEDFNIEGVSYSYVHRNPNPNAKYGVALSFWVTNWADAIFYGQLVQNTYYNKELVELSCCSYAEFPAEWLDEAKKVFNYIVKCDTDKGHQDGTTSHCNGAMYPLMCNPSIQTVQHSDADTMIIRDIYVFAFGNMLLDTNKVVLTSNVSWQFNHQEGRRFPFAPLGPGTHVERQFGGMFVVNKKRALETGYFPRPLLGHFEYDGYTHFINCGLTLENDAIIVPRLPFDQPGEVYLLFSMDFHLGVMHSSNDSWSVEDGEDRKVRLLRATGFDKWDNMCLGMAYKDTHPL